MHLKILRASKSACARSENKGSATASMKKARMGVKEGAVRTGCGRSVPDASSSLRPQVGGDVGTQLLDSRPPSLPPPPAAASFLTVSREGGDNTGSYHAGESQKQAVQVRREER